MGAAENASPLSRVSVVPTLRTCLRSDPQHTPRGDIEVSVLLTRLPISAERVARVSVVPTLWRPMLMRSAVQASPEREQAEQGTPLFGIDIQSHGRCDGKTRQAARTPVSMVSSNPAILVRRHPALAVLVGTSLPLPIRVSAAARGPPRHQALTRPCNAPAVACCRENLAGEARWTPFTTRRPRGTVRR